MTTEEGRIKAKITLELRSLGWLVFRLNSGRVRHNVRMCQAGTPDIEAISPEGRVVWIETKTPEGELSAAQIEMHEDLEMRNQEVFVWAGEDDIAELKP